MIDGIERNISHHFLVVKNFFQCYLNHMTLSLNIAKKKAVFRFRQPCEKFTVMFLEQLNNIVRENKNHQCKQENHPNLLGGFQELIGWLSS
jgi:hydroxyethylthiazole kinase-like sugar kinase family protein